MRLLLAEDEHELSDALCAILKHNHYSVDPVYDGQEALDYIRHGQYDGAILDIMMPKMDGLTVLRQVRSPETAFPSYSLPPNPKWMTAFAAWIWGRMTIW